MTTLSSAWLITYRELLGEQTDVERVEHRAHRRDREVRRQVLRRVPAERADPVAGLHAELGERGREAIGVVGDLART